MIVAGGGIIGLSCAWRLAQKGVTVTVFDARETGAEASWAGAGMLSPGGETNGDSPFARMALASLAQYGDFVEELQAASGIGIDYVRCGAIEFAFTDEEALALEQRAVQQAEIGICSEAVSPGRRFYAGDALVDPRDVTAALRIACVNTGVKIHEHEPVVEILPDGVRTGKDIYNDDAVLIAAGAWSSTLCPAGQPRAIPVRGHLIAFDDTGIRLDSILRHGHTYVLQRERSGRIIAGASTEYAGFDRSIDEAAVADVHARAAQLLPGLAALTPSDRWTGFRPGLEGNAGGPVVGRIPGTNIRTAYGHYRNGILLAPETARIIVSSFRDEGG